VETTEEIIEVDVDQPAPTAELLRQAREASNLDLSEVAARTRINPWILKRLEAGEFQALPAGVYARSYLRAYAGTVGLDPEATVRLFEPLLPRADERPNEVLRVRQPKGGPVPGGEAPPKTPLSGTLARGPASAPVPGVSPSRWRRLGAMAIDATLLAGLNGAILYLSALLCGLPVMTMFETSALAMSLLFGLAAFWYFSLLGGIGGRTAGSYLLGISLLDPPAGPLDLLAAGRRGVECLLKESSMLLDLLVAQSERGAASEPANQSPDGRVQL
jgi:uncharacterized RDD family membrane protein YckC